MGSNLKVLSVLLLIGHTGCSEDQHPTKHGGLAGISMLLPEGDLMAYLSKILFWLVRLRFYMKTSRFNLLNLFLMQVY